jgi:hypothetical protein
MADNTNVKDAGGNSVLFRTDELAGGVQCSVVKVALGGDGAENALLDEGQQASANSLSVTLASDLPIIAGTQIHRNLDADEDGTLQIAKAQSGVLHGFIVSNSASGTLYLKLYDKATAPLNTDTPAITIPIDPGLEMLPLPVPVAFSSGLSYRVTTDLPDNDTGAPGASECTLNLFYT